MTFMEQYDMLYKYITGSVKQASINDYRKMFDSLNYDFSIDDYSFNGGIQQTYNDPMLPQVIGMSVNDLELIYSNSVKDKSVKDKSVKNENEEVEENENEKVEDETKESTEENEKDNEETEKTEENEETEELDETDETDEDEEVEDENELDDMINSYYSSFKGGKSATSIIDDLKNEK